MILKNSVPEHDIRSRKLFENTDPPSFWNASTGRNIWWVSFTCGIKNWPFSSSLHHITSFFYQMLQFSFRLSLNVLLWNFVKFFFPELANYEHLSRCLLQVRLYHNEISLHALCSCGSIDFEFPFRSNGQSCSYSFSNSLHSFRRFSYPERFTIQEKHKSSHLINMNNRARSDKQHSQISAYKDATSLNHQCKFTMLTMNESTYSKYKQTAAITRP